MNFPIFANRKHSYSNINITINNQKIKQGKSIKYLGLTLSEDLSWQDRIDNLITKMNHRLGLLRRIKSYSPLDARCILYSSIHNLWGQEQLKKIQILKNEAAKLILDAPWPLSSATEALKTT